MQTLDIPWIYGYSERHEMEMLLQLLTRTARKVIVLAVMIKRGITKESV